MGPYCKFCNNRCFSYVTDEDRKKGYFYDIKANCAEGVKFDLQKIKERQEQQAKEKK